MNASPSQASNRPLALELCLLLLIFLVFPLDELVASYVFGRYEASGSEGFTLAHFLTLALFALVMWKALWRKDSEPLLLPLSNPVPILMLAYIGASLLSILTSTTPVPFPDACCPALCRKSQTNSKQPFFHSVVVF